MNSKEPMPLFDRIMSVLAVIFVGCVVTLTVVLTAVAVSKLLRDGL